MTVDLTLGLVGDATGTADVITATFSPAVTLTDKRKVWLVSTLANTTTTPTCNPNGVGAKVITMNGGQPLLAGSIGGGGHVLSLEYNSANNRWELLNPIPVFPLVAWTPTFTGYSVAPTIRRAEYIRGNGWVDCELYPVFNSGTSNANTLTFTGPFNALNSGDTGILTRVVNGGVSQNLFGWCQTTAGSNVITCYLNPTGTSDTLWTSSSSKTANAKIRYKI